MKIFTFCLMGFIGASAGELIYPGWGLIAGLAVMLFLWDRLFNREPEPQGRPSTDQGRISDTLEPVHLGGDKWGFEKNEQ